MKDILKNKDIKNTQGERIDYSFHAGARSDVLVILGHGVTGNKDRPLLVALAEGLSAQDWPCLRISYSGNGESGGKFVESTITKEIADLSAVISNVRDDVKIIYVGHSMGGAVGVLTAAQNKRINVLVSLAGMSFTRDFVMREFGDVTPEIGLMWDEEGRILSQRFIDDLGGIGDTIQAAAQIKQPWLIIHGTEDDIVPIEDGKAVYDVAVSDKHWLPIEGADHVFDESSYPVIINAIDNWIKTHVLSL